MYLYGTNVRLHVFLVGSMSVKRYYDADGADGDALGVHGYTANVSNVYVFRRWNPLRFHV